MPTIYEGPHAAQFILTEANGQRSRENVEIPVGQKFPPGTVLAAGVPAMSGADLAIAIYGADTTAPDAEPVKIACIARDAEVNRHAMAWPDGTTDEQIDDAATALAAQGIIVRGAALPSPNEAVPGGFGATLPSPGEQRVGEQRAPLRRDPLVGAGAGNPQPGSGSGIPVTDASGPAVQRPGDSPVKS